MIQLIAAIVISFPWPLRLLMSIDSNLPFFSSSIPPQISGSSSTQLQPRHCKLLACIDLLLPTQSFPLLFQSCPIQTYSVNPTLSKSSALAYQNVNQLLHTTPRLPSQHLTPSTAFLSSYHSLPNPQHCLFSPTALPL